MIPEDLLEEEDKDEVYFSRKPSAKITSNQPVDNGKILNEAIEKLKGTNIDNGNRIINL